MKESALASIAITLLGAVWIGYGVAFLVLLRGLQPGPNHFGFNVLLAVLLGTWASDIFAYFGGRLFGRRRLAPAISPKKTVEGFVIGLVFGSPPAGGRCTPATTTAAGGPGLGLAVALVGPLGDLFECSSSATWVKDSGTLLGRARRRARPHRRAAVRRGGGVLRRACVGASRYWGALRARAASSARGWSTMPASAMRGRSSAKPESCATARQR